MNNQLITQIALALISIIGAIFTYYVIPLIKAKIGETEYVQLTDFIEKTIRAANQLYDANGDKKQYVLNQALAWLQINNINLTDEQVNAIIEGLYNAVKINDKKSADNH